MNSRMFTENAWSTDGRVTVITLASAGEGPRSARLRSKSAAAEQTHIKWSELLCSCMVVNNYNNPQDSTHLMMCWLHCISWDKMIAGCFMLEVPRCRTEKLARTCETGSG
jgi:hypothetical protein